MNVRLNVATKPLESQRRHLSPRPHPDRVLSAISLTPRPTAGHSTAIDLATNASGAMTNVIIRHFRT